MTDRSTLWQLPATRLSALVKSRSVSATEITQSVLDRLAQVNPSINAVITEMPDEALEMASRVDKQLAKGESPGALAGIPVTIKTNVDQIGHCNTNGLQLLKDNLTSQDNPVVANLRKAGAIFVGRTNTPAFSMRWFTRNSLHGHTRNPVNPSITPGGSSGGAAASVAAGIGAIALGSDIAGSIRYPAYACGVHGIRPSLGRVPSINPGAPDRHIGAQITAVQGPLTRTIDDLELALHAMSARDIRDPWWTPAPQQFEQFEKKAALCINPDGLNTCPQVETALRESAVCLKDAGWTVTEVACPPMREPANMQILLWMSEMRRNDGATQIKKENDPDATFVFEQMQRDYPTPDLNGFLDLLQARAGFVREWMEFMEEYPVVLTPVSAVLPFKDNLDVESSQSFAEVLEAQMTQIGLPFMGMPSLAVSTGLIDRTPIGVQLVASRFREDILFAAAREIEKRNPLDLPVTPDF